MSMVARIRPRRDDDDHPYYAITMEVSGAYGSVGVGADEVDACRDRLIAGGWTVLDEDGEE